MGLDMYLYKKVYRYQMKDGSLISGKGMKLEDCYHTDEFGVSNSVELKYNIFYMRKANAIHRWFVDNIQDGKDECQESYVTEDNLHELRELCFKLLKKLNKTKFYMTDNNGKKIEHKDNFIFDVKKIKEYYKGNIWMMRFRNKRAVSMFEDYLPSQKGFFFGSTDYDGGYVYDLIKTVLMLDNIFKDLEKHKKEEGYGYNIYYQASW